MDCGSGALICANSFELMAETFGVVAVQLPRHGHKSATNLRNDMIWIAFAPGSIRAASAKIATFFYDSAAGSTA